MSENKYIIKGSRNYKSLFVMSSLFLGGLAFLITGIASYYTYLSISYIPQGILMTFYGSLFISLSFYIALTIFWDIGSGYNEFVNEEEIIYIVRKSFPGKNQFLFFSYPYKFIKLVRFLKKDGINPRCNILLILKDKREIPLYPAQILLTPDELEKVAISISSLLKVSLETKQA